MAEVFFDSDIYTNGKIKLNTVPNATGTVITYNSTTKELSTRTNAQIISDLGLEGGGLSSYVKKAGDTMTGSLTMNAGSATVINKDLSTITSASGFARDMFRLTGTNGVIDVFGWQGSVDSTGNITFGYGYLGGAAYNVKNAIRWNSSQQVRIGTTGAPTGSYALEVDGATLSRGNYDVQAGAFNTVSGELLIQRFGVNRIRTNTASLILSGDTSTGIIYLRPQGDAVATNQIMFNGNNTSQYTDNHNILIGSQTLSGSALFNTNKSDTVAGYGLWMGQNLQFDGTNFIQPRGALTSWGFTVNNHKNFSFNYGSNTGTNGGIPTLTEVVKISNTGLITSLNYGTSADWIAGFNNGFLYRGLLGTIDLNTITQTGWWVQTGNSNATVANNYPAPGGLSGQLRVYYTGTHIVQEYTTYANNNDVYRRYYFNGTWYGWAKDWDTNDFTQVNINSWNNIAANGATQQWVDQYYVNKSTQNVVKSTDWFITDDSSAGMEGKFRFQGGHPVIQWDNSSVLFSDEGFIDLTNYGIRQNDASPNHFQGYTQFFGRAGFPASQGTAPFDVISSTVVTNLNADLLDGRHASDFVLNTQIGAYALRDGSNATDTWVGNSYGAIYNPPYLGKSFNSGGGAGLLDATYGTQCGFINTSGTASGNPNDNWFHRIKMLHQNSSGYYTEIAVQMTSGNSMWYRKYENGVYNPSTNNGWIQVWDSGNFNPNNYVPVGRAITINGVTQDLSSDRVWNIPTGSTYTAGAGLTLTGTQFSLPVTQTGIGNAVTSVTQTATGITVNKGENFATTTDLDNYISKRPLQFRAVADANNAIGVDFYYLGGSNKPSGSTDGALLNMTYDNSLWNTQMYSDWRTNEWYVRVKSNGNWGSWQKLYHDGNLNPSAFVTTSRTITIDGVTQDLSANRSWTTNNTVTRLRGGGSFVSGDITIKGGANVTVSQSGQTITVAATDTNTTYSAGAGLTLTGTTFSLPVTVSGTGNGVASVVQNATGITVTKTDFALNSQLTNFVTTNTVQTITASKTFTSNITTETILDVNGGWMLGYGINGGEYGLYSKSNSNDLIAGVDGGYYAYGCAYNAFDGIVINPSTKNVGIGMASGGNKVTVNGAVKASGLVSNSVPQSPNIFWSTDGSARAVFTDKQWRLDVDGSTTFLDLDEYNDLGVVIYEHGAVENTMLALPRATRQGQEVQVVNKSVAAVRIAKDNDLSTFMNLESGMTYRFVFEILSNLGDKSEDKVGEGNWIHVASEKFTVL